MSAIHATVKFNHQFMEKAVTRLLNKKKLKPRTISVGIHEQEGTADKVDYNGDSQGITLAEVMAKHEFGAGKEIPERSWLRSWFDANVEQLKQDMITAMRFEVSRPGDPTAHIARSKRWQNNLIQWVITNSAKWEALSDFTIREKKAAGLANPTLQLIATNQFLKAIHAMLDKEYTTRK